MDEIISLNINEIAPNPHRARASFSQEDLIKLSDSIRKHGLLQPILVASTPIGYQIMSGERRWRAAKIAGLSKIPVLIRSVRPAEILLLSLVENIQRQSLTVFEQAGAIQRLHQDFGMTLQEIGEDLGLGVDEIEKRLALLNLSDKVKNEILSRKLSTQEALALVEKSDEKEVYEEVVRKPKHKF